MPINNVPDLVPIPAGLFWMGGTHSDSAAENNEKPIREIELPAFHICRYPVTNLQYAEYIRSTKRAAPLHWQSHIPPEDILNHPVVNVSSIDANLYCSWLSQQTGIKFTLPIEEQWEKAARGLANTQRYVWGDLWREDGCNTLEAGVGTTTAVCQYEKVNQSPFGVIDMLGNVWEWTESFYEGYSGSPHDSIRYGTSHLVVRGGSWKNSSDQARCSCRGRYLPGVKRPYLGFRIATNQPQLVIEQNVGSPHEQSRTSEIDKTNLPQLKNQIHNHFSLEEIQSLCFELGLSSDEFNVETKEKLVVKFLEYCYHRDLISKLVNILQEKRPNINWESVISS